MSATTNTCTVCGKPSIPGLHRGSGKCQYHWNAMLWGKEWADWVEKTRGAADAVKGRQP